MDTTMKKRLNDEFKVCSHYVEIFDVKEHKRYEIERKLQKTNNFDFDYKSEYQLSIDQMGLKLPAHAPFICNQLYFDSVKALFISDEYISIDLEFYLADNIIFNMHYFLIESPHFSSIHDELNKTLIVRLSRALTALDAIKEQNQSIDEMIKKAIHRQFLDIDFRNEIYTSL